MKGVFCLEGFWYGDHRDTTSVYPVLDLVERYQKMPFIYHRCGTIDEFRYSIKRWTSKSFHSKYPLLYLGFHGGPGLIKIGKYDLKLDELSELLIDKCSGVVIYFGSCSTIDLDRRHLQRFMEQTKSVALLGYKEDVGWLASASFDIQLLEKLFTHPFDTRGVTKICDEIFNENGTLARKLGFKMEINERVNFPRRRK